MHENAHQPHKEVPAKVTIFVDEGIKELVELLNTFDGVSTIDSCQGGDGELASISLCCGNPRESNLSDLVRCASNLAAILAKSAEESEDVEGAAYSANVSLEWWGDKRHPFVKIEMPRDCIDGVTSVLSQGRVHGASIV